MAEEDVTWPTGGEQARPRTSRLDALRRAVAAQQRLNSRIVRVSVPDTSIFELDMRMPTDADELEDLNRATSERVKKSGSTSKMALELAVCQAMLARFCVRIWDTGDEKPLIDAADERAAAFADQALLADLGARDSFDAVRALLQSDPVIIALGEQFIDEYNGDAEAVPVEDPTARG